MSSIPSLPSGAYAVSALPTLGRAEAPSTEGPASAWLDAGSSAAQGAQQVLHVSARDPEMSVDQIERDFIAALCSSAD